MSNEWDEYAENWDVDLTVKQYAKNAFSTLIDEISINELSILDFGCGTGALTELLNHNAKHIVAIDPSSAMISF